MNNKDTVDNSEKDDDVTPQQRKSKKRHHKVKKDKGKKNAAEDSEGSDDSKNEENKNDKVAQRQIKDLIAENFVLLTEIGHGAFGQIFLSYNMRENIEVAIKKELKKPQKIPQLRTEAKIYQTLLNIPLDSDLSGVNALSQQEVQGVSKFYGMGELLDSYYMIIEFLGPNLIELLNYCGNKRFTIATACLLALQILNRIEYLHKHHYIHRDIKPENFLIGTENKSNVVYLIDFGLSKRYKNPKNHQHIPYREGRLLTGTARYVSINTHLGIEQSRRDDLESIGYVLVFFLKGSLPWQGLKTGTDKYTRIMEKKLQIPTEILCYGLPDEMSIYLNYCKSLRFEDKPDYEYLRGLFIKLLGTCTVAYGITKEYLKFDWCFEDQNVLWKFYSQDNRSNNNNNNNYERSPNENNSVTDGKPPSNINNAKDLQKKLSQIKEDNENAKKQEENKGKGENKQEEQLQNSDENNPNVSSSQSKDSSSEDVHGKIQEKSSEASDETLKVEFNGISQAELLNRRNAESNEKVEPLLVHPQATEEIDKYIESIMQRCKLPKKITDEIKKRTIDVKGADEKSVDTVEVKHANPKNMSNILNKIHNNNANKDNDLSEDSVSLFNQKVNREKAKKEKEKEKEKEMENHNANLSGLDVNEIVNDLPEEPKEQKSEETEENEAPHFKANSQVTKKGKNDRENKVEEERLPNHHLSFKKKSNFDQLFEEEKPKLKLAKENIIQISKEPISKYYEVLNDLGQGSYGKVKKVRHKTLNEIRAMKIVNKKTQSNSNEIEVLRKISHPNIMNIFEIFEDSRNYYIMTEFLEGGELFDAITSRGFYSEIDGAKIMRQILLAVNYLHHSGIVHRDLKPENIMLISKNTDLKLIDFGTAVQKPKRGKKLNRFIGTSYYIAPEVIRECYDEKCDVWSCGVILYILLCGYPPFNGSSNQQIYSAIQYTELQFDQDEWSEISSEAMNLIRLMLEKNPEQRISAEEALNNPWFKIINDNTQNKAVIHSNKSKIIDKMAIFVQQNKFKQAVLQFISTEFNLKKEEEELKKMFKEFDKDGKGIISKEAFMEQIDKIDGEKVSKEIIAEIFNQIDLDGSGTISYNEFLTSIIDNKKIITEDRLEKAFKTFDRDHNGLLSVEEIRSFFGGDENTWKKVLKDVDKNGDGEVDFEEFKALMIGFDPKEIPADNTINR